MHVHVIVIPFVMIVMPAYLKDEGMLRQKVESSTKIKRGFFRVR